MKSIAAEAGNTTEVGFGGVISKTREIMLISFGTKYAERTATGWTYNISQALEDHQKNNPNSKFFLTGHAHPWSNDKSDAEGVNSDGVRRKGDLYKFYRREPTWQSYGSMYVDYVPLLTNPMNIQVFNNVFAEGGKEYVAKKGPHPLMIVTKYGYITYGSGRNESIQTHEDGSVVPNSVHRVELNSYYFHKY
jgi:hypothetical protein